MLNIIVLIFFFPPSQEQFHWLLFVGVTFRVSLSDVSYGISLTLP